MQVFCTNALAATRSPTKQHASLSISYGLQYIAAKVPRSPSSGRAVSLLLLLGLAGVGGRGGHVVLVGPGDEAVRREAAVALLGTPARPLAHGRHLPILLGGGASGRRGGAVVVLGRRGGVAERTPALDAVEAGQVGVEVDPHSGVHQLRVPAEQVPVAVHERLEHLHPKAESQDQKTDNFITNLNMYKTL